MPGNTGTIKIALKIDDKGSVKVLKSVGDESKRTGRKGKDAFDKVDRSAGSASRSVKKVSSAMLKIGSGVAVAAGIVGVAATLNKLTSATKEYVGLANVQEAAETDLAAVLSATGNAAGYNLDQLEKMASGMQDMTRTGDEVILGGMSILATFKQVRGEGFERATMAALDMSQVMKQDLKSSMVQIGKALNDPIVGLTALGRTGVTFTEDQKEMITTLQESGDIIGAQAIILKELESQFGGAAHAASKTFAGGMEQADNALGDMKEELGFVITKNQFFIDLTQLATKQFKIWGGQIAANREDLMLLAKQGVIGVVKALGTGIETLRFFHNGWLGIKLVGSLAVEGLALALDELYSIMKKLMLPNKLLFDGLVKLGAIDVNPFDALEQGFEDFRYSSAQVRREVEADIAKTNHVYDVVRDKVNSWEAAIARIPVTQAAADNKAVNSSRAALNSMKDAHNDYTDTVIGNQQAIAAAGLAKQFGDASRDVSGVNAAIGQYEAKKLQITDKMYSDLRLKAAGYFEYQEAKIRQEYELMKRITGDKVNSYKWYTEQIKAISEEQADDIKDPMLESLQAIQDVAENTFGDFEDSLVQMVRTGKFEFSSLADSIIADMARMAIQQSITGPMKSFLFGSGDDDNGFVGNLLGGLIGSRHGNVFDIRGLKAYAQGGTFTNQVVDKPTMFRHGGGFGVMGEAGPEAILPLTRTPGGDLGVKSDGGASNVNIAVVVTNNTSNETRATAQQPRWDGNSWVIGVVLDAINDNTGGFKNHMRAALRT